MTNTNLDLSTKRLKKEKNVNRENVRLWVDALRSGKFKQTTTTLASRPKGNGHRYSYCCLGVACEISGVAKATRSTGNKKVEKGYDGEHGTLPYSVRGWLGLSDANPELAYVEESLVSINDNHGATFDEIADLIERSWLQ